MSARTSTIRDKSITYGFWLIFDSAGGMRLARQRPNAGRAERAMFMEATLPRALFSTPDLRGTITVADPLDAPISIDVAAASEALSQALGVDIDLKVVG